MKESPLRRFLTAVIGFALVLQPLPVFAQTSSENGSEVEVGGGVPDLDAPPLSPTVEPFDDFVINDIRIEGLRRFSPGVIFSRIPVAVGESLSSEKAVEIIQELYETGYFRSVNILRDDDVLVVEVSENPTIAEVTVSGADELSDDALSNMLESVGIAEARVYNRSIIEEAARAIEEAYVERNFYHAEVESIASPLPRNRVAVLFNVEEGDEAAIRSIRILGNEAFSTWTLQRDMRLEPKGLLNFFSDNYRFSEQKLDADLARIYTRYLEAGYLRFEVEARQVEISTDKEHIDIIIRLNEGKQFFVSGVSFELAPDSPPPEFELDIFQPFIRHKAGEIYTGRASSETVSEIRELLGNMGYANAGVTIDPRINDEEGSVEIVYVVAPQSVSYVRQINIIGNEFTSDEVIRREMLQFERERYSSDKVNRSRSRIRRLGYFNRVNISSKPVPDSPGEVDLFVEVDEINTGEISFGAGFSSDGGVSTRAGFSNSNIFGTGNDFEANVSWDEDEIDFDFNLDEHYYTEDGVTRHIGATYGETSAGDDSSAYSIDGYKGEYGFDFPFTDDGKYNLYLVYQQVNINDSSDLDDAYQSFITEHGDNFDTILLDAGLVYDTRDAANIPSEGHRAQLNGEIALPILELAYYYFDYRHDYYHTFRHWPTEPVMHLRLSYGYGDGYGDGVYPFYRRFHLGGTTSLRGFSSNSIGYGLDENNDALGGKSRLFGTMEFSADVEFFEEQQVFFVPFVDTGAVGKDFGLGKFRASWGAELRWLSPLGPLRFSYVEAFLAEDEDDVETFQFSVSTF